MMTPLNVLTIEDSADDTLLIMNELQTAGFEPTWIRVENEPDYCTCLEAQPDIIFSDFTLPQFSTPRALELLQKSSLEIPFIIVSGTIGEERAVECLKTGATDYVLKDRLQRLGPVVRRAFREVRSREDHRRLEEQLRQMQKMESIGQLAGGVAHDFNNLLTIIRGSTELLLMDGERLNAEDREHLKQVISASERSADLVRQLLTFSRKQAMQLRRINLNEVANNLVKMLKRVIGEDVLLSVNLASNLSAIRADVGMMEQVLMNLAINARDAMPQGGELTITTANESIGPTYVQSHPQATIGEFICLTVTDTGCGIPREHLSRIFEPFFTTKDIGQGTGLGLATVYGIVQQHHGWITVYSELVKGTTFHIHLPALAHGSEESPPPGSDKSMWGGSETILLVEDETSIRGLAHNILLRLGYRVIEAESGVTALDIWRKRRNQIDLILTDIVMPGGVSGLDLAKALRAEHPSLRVIYTSGYSADIMGKNFELREGINFLQKPYPPHKLAQTVRAALNRSATPAG
jgi:signal transduction histidine kinase